MLRQLPGPRVKILCKEAFAALSTSSSSSSSIAEDATATVYVDGSCMAASGRRHVGGAGIYWGEDDPRNLAHPILSIVGDDGGKIDATSNRAELTAAFLAVQMARDEGITHLKVVTDSMLVVNGMETWIKAWMKNEWRTQKGIVKNRRLFLLLWVACRQMKAVEWEHVYGHRGQLGNEAAHRLATEGAEKALETFYLKYDALNDDDDDDDDAGCRINHDDEDDDDLLEIMNSVESGGEQGAKKKKVKTKTKKKTAKNVF